jgi:hypothetical protein
MDRALRLVRFAWTALRLRSFSRARWVADYENHEGSHWK